MNEPLIVPLIGAYLRRHGNWVETHVTPWPEMVPYDSPTDVLKKYAHPLQPDVDILYGPELNNRQQTPLCGMEVKVFAKYKGTVRRTGAQDWPVIPKTKSPELGFYAGLGQALVLYQFGIDFIFLCHVFILPPHEWEENSAQNSHIADVLVDELSEWSGAHGGIVTGTISKLNLPLGYLQLGVLIDNPVQLSVILKKNARIVHLCHTGRRIRDLFLEKFKIDDRVYQKDYIPAKGTGTHDNS